MTDSAADILFVVAVSRLAVLRERLLASPCLRPGGRALVLRWNARSAAEALNPVLEAAGRARWVVWVHQDVFLPDGWDERFLEAADRARREHDDLAVVGVYGVSGAGDQARHAGHVLDRGTWLRGPATLPCPVDSLDELLFALPGDSPLRLDPALGFDLYATDLVLQAQARGLQARVIEAPCEHWSDTPREGAVRGDLIDRVVRSGDAFERKWAARLPVCTPCFDIRQPGDVRRFAATFTRLAAGDA
jgi:nucleotide-binding universal stress UspA family protein